MVFIDMIEHGIPFDLLLAFIEFITFNTFRFWLNESLFILFENSDDCVGLKDKGLIQSIKIILIILLLKSNSFDLNGSLLIFHS